MRGRISKSPGSRRALQPLERQRTGKEIIDHLVKMIHDDNICDSNDGSDGNDGNAIMEMQWWQAMMAMIAMMAKMAMMEMRETQ